ncbi:MAG: xanthine dehydrogenase family protein molybdopterin-binding subunit, partial [Acidimicrobiales bacterium]
MPGPATGMGRSPRRREDPRLLTGQAAFLDDISLPDQCVGVFVRSSSASAALGQIRTGAALAAPGVVAVFTGADLAGRVAPVPL